MAKLTTEHWQEIRIKYELGQKVRDIAKSYKYDAGNIVKKAKQMGWEHARIQQPIATATRLINEVTENLQPSELAVVNKELNHQLEMMQFIENIDKGAMTLHHLVLKRTLDKIKNDTLSEREASQIASNMGLSIDKIAGRSGMKDGNNSTVNVNTQINNKDEPISITFNGK